MRKVTIFLDYDDVVVDWVSASAKTFNLDLKDLSVRTVLEEKWGGIDAYVSEEKLWETIHKKGAKWWEALPLLPWGKELYEKLSEVGEVCFLTAPSDHPSCASGKVSSIKKHFNTRNFLIGKPKHLCAQMSSILIDDRPDNCKKFVDAGGQAFQWPNALKVMRVGGADQLIQQAVDFVKSVDLHWQTKSHFSFYCIPELVDAETTV